VFVGEKHVPGGESGTRQSFIRVHSPLQAEIDHPNQDYCRRECLFTGGFCEGQLAPYKQGVNLATKYKIISFSAD
jgi:hypothetical protein